MNPALIGVITFVFAFGGVLAGTWLRSALPGEHLDGESKDLIKLGIGLVATMTALVLGLVTASAKSSFDALDGAIKDSAVKLLAMDRALARYGPDAAEIRVQLKQALGERIDMIWSTDSLPLASLDPSTDGRAARVEGLVDAILSLKPNEDVQRAHQMRAVDLAEDLLQARWLVMTGNESSVPVLFLAVVLFWLTVIFASFGIFATNRTGITVLFVCAVSIGAALFLVLEMDGPFDGLIRVSPAPLQFAYVRMDR